MRVESRQNPGRSAQQIDLARWPVDPVASAGEGRQGFNAADPLEGEDTGSTVQEGEVCVHHKLNIHNNYKGSLWLGPGVNGSRYKRTTTLTMESLGQRCFTQCGSCILCVFTCNWIGHVVVLEQLLWLSGII